MPRLFIAICVLFALGAPSIGAAQRMEFEATPSEMTWPPTGEVSFEELCRGAAQQAVIEGYSQHATCTLTRREGEYVVVQLQVGVIWDLHLLTQTGSEYRYIGRFDSSQSEGNHANDVRVLEIRARSYLGETYVLLSMRHSSSDYYGMGQHQCTIEYLQICRPNDGAEPCENRIGTRSECDARPAGHPQTGASWWRARHVAGSSIARADVEVSDEGLLHLTLREGTWANLLSYGHAAPDPEQLRITLRFAPPPPAPEAPPFIQGVCRTTEHEDEWQDRCDDRPRGSRYGVSLQWHADFQALCDNARGSSLDVTACSEEAVTRSLSIIRVRRDEEAGPTFLAERRGRSVRLISRMSDPYPQSSVLHLVRYVRGPGRYYGVEFEERFRDGQRTTRRHLLVCQRSRNDPRCSLRVPLRVSTQSSREERGIGRLQIEHLSQAEAEIRRDGTLTLTRVSGTWAELFGGEPAPAEDQESVTYRYR